MYTFRSFARNYMMHRAATEQTVNTGGIITKEMSHGLPIQFTDHKFSTESEDVAKFIRSTPLFGKEILETTGIVEVAPEKEKTSGVIAAKGKNAMIQYLVSHKLKTIPEFKGMKLEDIQAMALKEFGITFVDEVVPPPAAGAQGNETAQTGDGTPPDETANLLN